MSNTRGWQIRTCLRVDWQVGGCQWDASCFLFWLWSHPSSRRLSFRHDSCETNQVRIARSLSPASENWNRRLCTFLGADLRVHGWHRSKTISTRNIKIFCRAQVFRVSTDGQECSVNNSHSSSKHDAISHDGSTLTATATHTYTHTYTLGDLGMKPKNGRETCGCVFWCDLVIRLTLFLVPPFFFFLACLCLFVCVCAFFQPHEPPQK